MCFCDDHVKRKGFKYGKSQAYPCPKCGHDTAQTKELSMSSKYLLGSVPHIINHLNTILHQAADACWY